MQHDQKRFAPEAAAKPAALPAPAEPAPQFASPAEEDAYWRGVNFAIRSGATCPEAASASPRVRRARHDGFSGPRQAIFLEAIAEGLTVAEAAARAGISPTTAYNFRNRRAGRAFNLAWEAACRRARRPLADHLHDRSLAGQVETYRDGDGEIVGTRHRHDNRLAMAMLTRLDRKAEAYKEDERLVGVLAEEFEELLDVIEAEGDAEDFIDSRRPPEEPYCPRERAAEADMDRVGAYATRHRYDGVDPAEIDTSDLDLDLIYGWTSDQWVRATVTGLLDREEDAGSGGGDA
jgi:hypothetical protein